MKKTTLPIFLVMLVSNCGEMSESDLLTEAFELHRHAVATTANADFERAAAAYEDYLDQFGDRTADMHVTFYMAEVLYRAERWEEAANLYDVVASSVKSKSDHAELAGIGADMARKKQFRYLLRKQGSAAIKPQSIGQ